MKITWITYREESHLNMIQEKTPSLHDADWAYWLKMVGAYARPSFADARR